MRHERRGTLGSDRLFDPLEPVADAFPARRDEVDEHGEVVDPCVPLGEQVSFEPLQPTNGLVEEAPDLGQVAGDGHHLGTKAVVHGRSDPLRERSLELGRRGRERLDLGA